MTQEKIYEVELTREELEIITVALTDRNVLTLRLINYCDDKHLNFVDYLNSKEMLVMRMEKLLNNI